MARSQKPVLLVVSQVYVPDPASVGQHLADAAEAMATRDYRVVVLTSRCGYENPTIKYPPREYRNGVDVVRLPFSSFGKQTLFHRAVGQCLFLLQVIVRGLFTRRLTRILVSTSPPMASSAAVVIGFLRRVPITYWLMDLNPDQVVLTGRFSERSPLVLAMKWLNRRIFSQAATVVVLDPYMARRVEQQYHVRGQLEILPPWPHENATQASSSALNPFQDQHNPTDRFVVMYSGNHSLVSPITTLLQAALSVQDDPRFLFMFVGGGLGKKEVDAAIETLRPTNVVSLPYQPLESLKHSLSTADLHVVTIGDDMPGIIHPCKIYGAMEAARPVLLIGPRSSHAGDILESYEVGWQIEHGDVAGTIRLLQEIVQLPQMKLAEIGERANSAVRQKYSKRLLCSAFCDLIEGLPAKANSEELSAAPVSHNKSRTFASPNRPELAASQR